MSNEEKPSFKKIISKGLQLIEEALAQPDVSSMTRKITEARGYLAGAKDMGELMDSVLVAINEHGNS